jgi:hypothetical protein
MIEFEMNGTDKLLERLNKLTDLSEVTLAELFLLSLDNTPVVGVQDNLVIELSEESYDKFLKDLEEPVEPTEALIRLFKDDE